MIGNRDLYSRKPPYAEKHKVGRKIQRVQRDREEKKLSTQERALEHRERVTRGESPSPRPVKQSPTKRG